ncbi:ASCH domain-containing protein [Desemzia sp. C1]|uniref:ASCH domain-containing protein n=1 Tax=Desemzia sp. C1 TaxID=2892016 RepID=UPI001E5B9AE8|nr:ASCH domain-containing protein [Desemzia sp. C1]MCI3029528.1 ASCH domain-containing protein [Desemzia sp. C1]
MKATELWGRFIEEYPEQKNADYEAWSYGAYPDELAELTLRGIKTATTSGYELYEIEDEVIPQENELSIILDGNGNAVCIIKITKVYVTPFNKVSKDHAFKEGEGDRTLDYWRKVHIDFFSKEYTNNNRIFDEEALVVCEEFEVIYRP